MRQILKYPGSKWNIASQLAELIPEHHSYVEPYAGSMALLFTKPPSDIETVNDLDSDVTNLFRCIQKDSERLARLVMTTPFSREEYDRQFEIPQGAVIIDSYERAAGFLVRCWQGHGFRTNGYKVGWKNDVQGRERMYALWNWYRLPEWIIEITERLRTVQIENRPALEVIKRFNYDNVFMYLDPPYLLGTRTAKQYMYEMTDADHEELLKTILQSRAKIMISGYESEMYNDYLNGWNKQQFRCCSEYGASRMEIIWMNYKKDYQMNIFDCGVEP
jgi:DNA adenine methylase